MATRFTSEIPFPTTWDTTVMAKTKKMVQTTRNISDVRQTTTSHVTTESTAHPREPRELFVATESGRKCILTVSTCSFDVPVALYPVCSVGLVLIMYRCSRKPKTKSATSLFQFPNFPLLLRNSCCCHLLHQEVRIPGGDTFP